MQNVTFRGWGTNPMGAKFEGVSEKQIDNPEKGLPTIATAVGGSAPLECMFGELYEGETDDLLALYDKYIKCAGGLREINGKTVHVTGALDVNRSASDTLIAIQKRLKELGVK